MVRSAPAAFRRLARDQSGSVLVEAALVIPVVLLVAFGVVMTGRIVAAQIGVEAVAREAGRALAVAPSASEGLAEARARGVAAALGHGLRAEVLELDLDAGAFHRGGIVRARASYRVELGDLPLLGMVAITVSAEHAERVELYRSRVAVGAVSGGVRGLHRDERGGAAVLVAVFLLGLVAVSGLVADGGLVLAERRGLQNLADAAAAAGAMQLDEAAYRASGGTVSLDEWAAKQAATAYLRDAGDVEFEVLTGPGRVEVRVARPAPTAFLGVLGIDSVTVSARATAEPRAGVGAGGG